MGRHNNKQWWLGQAQQALEAHIMEIPTFDKNKCSSSSSSSSSSADLSTDVLLIFKRIWGHFKINFSIPNSHIFDFSKSVRDRPENTPKPSQNHPQAIPNPSQIFDFFDFFLTLGPTLEFLGGRRLTPIGLFGTYQYTGIFKAYLSISGLFLSIRGLFLSVFATLFSIFVHLLSFSYTRSIFSNTCSACLYDHGKIRTSWKSWLLIKKTMQQ